ncbi:hypothetical protein ACFX1T_022646 [Malus domestica]
MSMGVNETLNMHFQCVRYKLCGTRPITAMKGFIWVGSVNTPCIARGRYVWVECAYPRPADPGHYPGVDDGFAYNCVTTTWPSVAQGHHCLPAYSSLHGERERVPWVENLIFHGRRTNIVKEEGRRRLGHHRRLGSTMVALVATRVCSFFRCKPTDIGLVEINGGVVSSIKFRSNPGKMMFIDNRDQRWRFWSSTTTYSHRWCRLVFVWMHSARCVIGSHGLTRGEVLSNELQYSFWRALTHSVDA